MDEVLCAALNKPRDGLPENRRAVFICFYASLLLDDSRWMDRIFAAVYLGEEFLDMEPLELLFPPDTNGEYFRSGVWACGKCRKVSSGHSFARECCDRLPCTHCGKTCRQHWSICEACNWEQIRKKEQVILGKAELVTCEPDQLVHCPGYGNDGYITYEDLLDQLEGEPEDWPERVHVCVEIPFSGISLKHALETMYEDLPEAYEDQIAGIKELEAAHEKFVHVNKNLITYEPDQHRAVLVREPARRLLAK